MDDHDPGWNRYAKRLCHRIPCLSNCNSMAKLTVTAPQRQILAASTATIGVYADNGNGIEPLHFSFTTNPGDEAIIRRPDRTTQRHSGTMAETNQTDRNVENSFSNLNHELAAGTVGTSQSGIFGSFQTTATQSIVNTVDTNLTSTVSAAETSTGNTTEIRTGNNNSGDYAGAVFGLTTTSSEETDSNQTQLAMSDGNSVELDTESSGGNNNSGTYFRNSSSQVVSNDATVENILTDTVAALSSSTSDDSEFKSGNSIIIRALAPSPITVYSAARRLTKSRPTKLSPPVRTRLPRIFPRPRSRGNDIYQTVSVSETSG